MKENFVKQGYRPSLINKHLEKIDLLNRIDLIMEKDTQQKSDRISFAITYHRCLPDITKTIRNNWNVLMTKALKKVSKMCQSQNLNEGAINKWCL